MLNIYIRGMPNIRRGLRKLGPRVQENARKKTEKTANYTRDRAKEHASTGLNGPGSGMWTGALVHGIQNKRTGTISYKVFSQSVKSILYEEGFRTHFVDTLLHPQVMDWVKSRGKENRLYRGRFLLVRGNMWNRRAFMRKAGMDAEERYPREMREAASRAIRESFGGL